MAWLWWLGAALVLAISEELSLGLDAMVFLDDNPGERDLVRRAMDAAQGNQSEAAQALGLGYHQFRRLLRKYAA